MKNQQAQSGKVYEAIINIMSEIGAISKSRKNVQQGYSFRGVDDVLNSLQPLLVKHQLIILPNVIERKETERTTKNGGIMLHVIVQMSFTCISTIDGSEIVSIMSGEAMDSGDKATNKAMSTAYKYFAFQLFCIPTDEPKDSEIDSPVIEAKSVAVKPNPATSTGDSEKEWLNLYNKNGSPNDKGEKAKKFIRDGGSVEDIAKKYKLSKAVREELSVLESQTKHMVTSKATAQQNPSSVEANEYDLFDSGNEDYNIF
jgi:hypothetical protein